MADRWESPGSVIEGRPVPPVDEAQGRVTDARSGVRVAERLPPGIELADLVETLDRISDGFMLLAPDWTILYVNPTGYSLLRNQHLIGRLFMDAFPGVETTDFFVCYSRAMQEQEPQHVISFYAPFEAWFEAHAYPSPRGVTIYFRDVTERHSYYALLAEENERFALVARATRDIVYDFAVQENRVWRSDAIEAVLGYTQDEQRGEPEWWLGLIHPEDLPAFRAAFARFTAADGGDSLSVEYRVRRKDGRWAILMSRSCAVRDESGRAVRVIGALTDVTRQREAEMGLAESKARLIALSRRLLETQEEERRKLARDLHDQLGQSLTALKLAVAAGVEDATGELGGMIDATIEDVRTLARDLRPPLLDQLGLVAALEREVEVFSRRTGLDVRISAAAHVNIPPDVSIACFRIVQEALTNIARHACASNADVTVKVIRNALHITVTDDGVGIERRRFDGEGSLGIAGMLERARFMGGTLSINSKPKRGTRVQVIVPLVDREVR